MAQVVPLLILAIATGYAPAAGGINCDSDCSITAYGFAPGPHIAACGTMWHPGDVLAVEDYGVVMCGDKFGANVRPHRLDLWFPSRAAALAWGVREVEVAWVGRLDVRH